MRFMSEQDYAQPIYAVMTKKIFCDGAGWHNIKEAQEILRKHRIEKLPIVDAHGNLKGLTLRISKGGTVSKTRERRRRTSALRRGGNRCNR